VGNVITLFGAVVAVQYLVIGLYVVPRLARLAEYRGPLIRLAQWGAAAYFVGCGLTHTGVAVHTVTEPLQGSAAHLLMAHVAPHIAQVVGGWTFIAIAARKLDIRFAAKEDATAERTRARLAALVEDSQDAIIAVDKRRRVTAWNPGAERLLGFRSEEMIGRSVADTVPAEEAARHDALIRRVLEHGEPMQAEGVRRRRDGTAVAVALSASPMRGATGTIIGASAIMRDVSERKRQEAHRNELLGQLAEAEERFRSAFEQAPTGVALVSLRPDSAGRFLQVNPALCEMLGLDADALMGTTCFDVTHPDDREGHGRPLRAALAGEAHEIRDELRLVRADGGAITVQVRATSVRDRDGAPLYLVCHVQDVTEDRRQEAHLRYLANHDPLTGLVNRRRFEEELDRAVAQARRHEPAGALLVVDLDNFKYVNDTFGHAAGDRLLLAAAEAMRSRLRDSDVIGRLGGDEFGVILSRASVEDARTVAEALLTAIRKDAHIEVAGRPVRISASVGVSPISGGDPLSAEQLLAEADVAMYDAKEAGRDRATLAGAGEDGRARMRQRFGWSQRIRDALERDLFELWEQPILHLPTGCRERSELLLRMRTKDRIIAPGEFLDVAERFGQIQAIDRWVVAQAVRLLAERRAAGEDPTVEINLSGASITDEAVMDHITAEVTNAPIDPTRVVFEITETAAIDNVERAQRFARRLSQLGCQFALDDFGAGFGSFYYLKHLPFDAIKIDGDFIRHLPSSPTDQATVKAIVDIARALGKHTIAEAAGNQATLDRLRELGVDYAQGYHIARPMPARAPIARAA
jgi:diguanylate cyclase (GGDEF)-like protein/PAS domain S-box-containing protein